DWWQEARESLSHGEGDQLAADDGKSAHADVLALLGPTDDPHMLGRIGTYEVIGILGRGGMGVVFKGFDGALHRYVAIKMLLPHLATSGGARKRFAREAQAAAAVVHDHVMAIHSVAEWQGVPYLVMPYGRGVSLQKRLSDQGPLEVREILRIGMQTAAGLAAAHAQGLVHRDVKPANILLDDGVERVTLTDFGLARAVDDASLTRIGVLAGTPQYMSPEQARAKAVDARSDLFSLGSVLYAMCTGRSPFRADSSYGVLRLITDEEPTPVRDINPEIPEWLCMIVNQLMAKRPEDRFSSASELAELLESCLAHVQQPTAAALPSSLSPSKGVSVLSRYKQLIAGVLVMVATLAFGLAAVLAWQGTAPPDIAGKWTGEDWGTVVLEATQPGQYEGTFSGSGKDKPATDNRTNLNVRVPDGGTVLIRAPKSAFDKGKSGTLHLKWSRAERRFNGTWEEGDERSGKISLRLVGDEIRGAGTTGKNVAKATGTARLADLLWNRSTENTAQNADLELMVDKEVRYRTKAHPEWRPVPRAGVSKLLRDGQTIVIHVKENVPYERVQEIIESASQRLDVTVTVVQKDSEVTVISNPVTEGKQRAESDAYSSMLGTTGDDSLEGVWELALPRDIAAKRPEDQRLRLVFSGDWYGSFRGSQLVSASRFEAEPQHTLKRLSFVDRITFGEVEGRSMRGIYEVKDDGLRLSLAVDTLSLPTKFGTEHPEFKRVKGQLAQEQVEALKLYSKNATTTDASNASGVEKPLVGVLQHIVDKDSRTLPGDDPGTMPKSEHERAEAKVVLVFFQDKSRRAVPCLVLNIGGKTLVVTTSPAAIVPEGTTPAVDRAFVELEGKTPTAVEYDSRSTRELYVYGLKEDLHAILLKETASVSVKDSVSAVGIAGLAPRQATVVALDRHAELELRERSIKHQYKNLIEVDQSFPEGTPLYKEGKLVGLTLLGSRFVGADAKKSYVVPAERIVELCQRIEQGTADAELERFQGTWVLVSSESNGEAKSEAKNPYVFTFQGTHWMVHREDEVALEGTLQLVDVTSTPRKLDLLKPKGLGPVPTVDYGIYEWKDDTLRYCVRNGPVNNGPPGMMGATELRPKEFVTRNGDGRILYLWKRAEIVGPLQGAGVNRNYPPPKSQAPAANPPKN
ncbi:MAG: protein kinase, partial [Planctomycetaceae bacterium]|nr:protein kinase [Planctomycetaceae bacterium]